MLKLRNKLTAAICAALGASLVGSAGSAEHVAFGVPFAVENQRANLQSGVYVRDSAIAADKFELGKRMERLKEWHKSADVYQEILEKYKDRVVPVQTDEQGRPVKYASVTVAVQQRLCGWPEEGLTVYRARFEPAAALIVDQAGHNDLGGLHRVVESYFVTDSAREAAIRLIDIYLERGEFSAAARLGERLLKWHPHLQVQRASVLFRTANACHFAGNSAAAQRLFDELKQQHPNELGMVAGKDVRLVDALTEVLSQPAPAATASGAEAWLTFGGDASRDRLPVASASAGTRVYSVELTSPQLANLPENVRAAFLAQVDESRRRGTTRGVIPVADDGAAFFQDGQQVYALNIESGVSLPQWQQTYPQQGGRFRLSLRQAPNDASFSASLIYPAQYTLTLTDNAVLAVMGTPATRLARGDERGTRLVCLDRHNGRQLWTASPASLKDDARGQRDIDFSGSPLVIGDHVYVLARGGSGGGVEDCYVYCFSLSDGKYKWASYVASAQKSVPGMGAELFVPGMDTVSHPAFAGGRLYVLTNLGAVAAIDAYSGATAWLAVYARSGDLGGVNFNGNFNGRWPGPVHEDLLRANGPRPWEFNAAIVRDGRVFVLPSDGKHLIIYDADSGEELRRIDRQIECEDRLNAGGLGSTSYSLNMLLGVSGNRLIVTGERAGASALFILDWTKCAPRAPGSRRLTDESILYYGMFDPPIAGRPFATSTHVYVPIESGLRVVDIDHGRVVGWYPKNSDTWPDDEGPGNVLVWRDHIVLAGANRVNVYTDLDQIRKKYNAAIEQNPADVSMRLTYAEMLFNAGEPEDGLQMLETAVQTLGGRQAQGNSPARQRIYADAILFSQRLSRSASNAALVDQLLAIAAAAANGPLQQAQYRETHARLLVARGQTEDLTRAVQFYQQILLDRSMRSAALSQGSAGKLAEQAVAELMSQHGRGLYEPFEQEASRQLESLRQAKDADGLLQLAAAYPNSAAAPAAMLESADLLERADRPRVATQVLRQIYWRYGAAMPASRRQSLNEAMARNYLRCGNLPAAIGRLQNGDNKPFDRPLVLADGRVLTSDNGEPLTGVPDALAKLQQMLRDSEAARLPDAKIPPPVTAAQRMAGEAPKVPLAAPENWPMIRAERLLSPPAALSVFSRHDRILTLSNNQLVCYPIGNPNPLWESDAAGLTTGIAWLDRKLLAWSPTEVVLLDAETGTAQWRVSLESMPEAAPLPPAEDETADVSVQVTIPANEMMLRRALIIRNRAAVAQPVNANEVETIVNVWPLSDRIIVATNSGRIGALSRESGEPLWQAQLAETGQLQQISCTDEFIAARLNDQQPRLIVLDAFDGQPVLRRSFVPNNPLVNCVLSPAGVVVWTTNQGIAAKDLYENGNKPTWERVGQYTFTAMSSPDHLQVYGDQVLAACNFGQLLLRHSVRTGGLIGNPLATMLEQSAEQAQQANLALERVAEPSLKIVLAGPVLYSVSRSAVLSYHLEEQTSYNARMNPAAHSLLSPLVTKDFLVLPGVAADNPGNYHLDAYSRAIVRRSNGQMAESGWWAYAFRFSQPGKITDWQAVDGGIYYVSADRALHWLKGTAQ